MGPVGYPPHTYDDLRLEAAFESEPRIVQRADIDDFARISGDKTALHTDEAYAAMTPLGGLVAHGVLNLAVATGLAYGLGLFEGTVLAVQAMDVRFERPVHPGDSVRLRLVVQALDQRPRPDRGRVSFGVDLQNQHRRTVLSGTWQILLRRTAVPAAP